MYGVVCMVISVCWCPRRAASDTGYPAVGIRGSCKSPKLGTRNQTEDLLKTSVCCDLLPHLSSPKEVESHLKVSLAKWVTHTSQKTLKHCWKKDALCSWKARIDPVERSHCP